MENLKSKNVCIEIMQDVVKRFPEIKGNMFNCLDLSKPIIPDWHKGGITKDEGPYYTFWDGEEINWGFEYSATHNDLVPYAWACKQEDVENPNTPIGCFIDLCNKKGLGVDIF